MSIAFNQGPAGVPLARILASLFAARSRVSRDVGVRGRTTHANTAMMSTNLLPGVLWRADDGLELDITSAQNTKVKLMRSFHKRRTRDAEGKTLVEGHRLVCDLIEGGHTPSLVIVSREALRASRGPRLQTALETLDADIVSVATAEVVQRCCDTVTSQGVVALIDRPVLPLPTALRMVLVCDGIQDPGNLGTLIRTAKGLGVDGVVLTGACVDYWSPKAVRSSMGASFRLPALVVESWDDVVGLMRNHGVRMYAAEGDASLSYFDADWTFPSALVVGAEARGLSDDARRGLERGEIVGVSVPLEGGVESLNAAVAGAVVLGEAQRQRAMTERVLTLGGATEAPATRDGMSTNAQ